MKKKIENNNNINIMEFYDKYDLQKVKNLYSLTDEELIKHTNYTEYNQEENKVYIKIIKQSLKEILLTNKTENIIEYEVKDCNRLYSNNNKSLQYYSNNILHYILPNNSYEVDMKNCNPQILLYLFKKHNLEHSNLQNYCNNRDKLLKESNINKSFVLKLFNKDSREIHNIKWLDDLLQELNNNKPILYAQEQDKINKTYIDHKKKSYNFLSSMICSIIWYYENKILMNATKLYKCIVPRFDGFYTDDCNIDLEQLNSITKEYNITWTKKNIDKTINIEDTNIDIGNLLYDINSNKYEDIEYYFNKTHFKIINNATFIRITNEVDIELLNTKLLLESYKHKFYEHYNSKLEIIEDKCFIDRWIKANRNMITFDKMEYYPDPTKCPPNHYNLWKKFDVELITEYKYVEDDLQFLLNHIKILCGNNDEVFNYVIKYIAHLFYRPAEKIGKMILFTSKEGTGKNTFYTLLRNMIGKRFYSVVDVNKNLLGNFNNCLLNSYVINLEEVNYFDTRDKFDILKNMITETELEVNSKSKDGKIIQSVHRLIGNTNNTTIPLPISATDRRFCIIRSSDEKKGNTEYFTKLHKITKTTDLQATFYKYLSTFDIDTFIQEDIPQTEFLQELKSTFESPIIDFIKYLTLHTKKISIDNTSFNLFTEFGNYLTKVKSKIGSDWSIKKFGLEMNEIIRDNRQFAERYKKCGMNYYTIYCDKVRTYYKFYEMPDPQEFIESDSD